MLKFQFFRENGVQFAKRLTPRIFGGTDFFNQISSLVDVRGGLKLKVESLQAASNAVAKKIGELMRAGKKEEAEAAKQEAAQSKDAIKELSDRLQENEQQLHDLLVQIPNVPHHSVPKGVSEEDNETLF